MPIKVALADDHHLVRHGIKSIVNAFPDFEVILEASNGKQFLELIHTAEQKPDLALLDISMPVMDGIQTAKALKDTYPDIKVVALSVNDDIQSVSAMIENGACAYMVKDTMPDVMLTTLLNVYEKGYSYDAFVVESLMKMKLKAKNDALEHERQQQTNDNLKAFTTREIEFIKLCCSEMPYKDIADIMNVSTRTVDGYRDAVFAKLDVKSRIGIVLFAVNNGLIQHS